MEVITNNKGGLKGYFNGYMYIVKYRGVHLVTWQCAKRTSLNCPGTCRTELDYTKPFIRNDHVAECEPDEEGFAYARFRDQLKKRLIAKYTNNVNIEGKNTNYGYVEGCQPNEEGLVYARKQDQVKEQLNETYVNYVDNANIGGKNPF